MQPTPAVDPVVAKMKAELAQAGYQPPAPAGQSNWQSQVKLYGGGTAAPQDNPASDIAGNYMGDVAPIAEDANDLAKGFSGGTLDDGAPEGNIGKAEQDFSKGGLENDAAGAEDAALGVGSDAVSAIFAPLAAPIQTMIKANAAGNAAKTPEKIAPAAQAIKDWASGLMQSHPDIAKTLGDAFNVGGAALGSGALDTTVSDAATAAKGTVTDAASAAKDLVTPTPVGPAEAATNLISQDPETMTQGMKNEAVAQGRQLITPNKGGTDVTFKPTAQIERAGKILSDPAQVGSPIQAGDKANVVVAKVKSAISTKGAQAEAYLDANPEYVSNEDASKMVSDMKQAASRKLTPAQMNAYGDQLDLFQKQLEDQVTKSGTINTADYYRALKSYEDNIASQFKGGKEALIDPEGIGSAKVQAAADIRSNVRSMIGAKNPEFADKMQDIASLYEARDNAIFNAGKTKSATFFDKNPRLKIAAETGLGLAGAETLHKVITGGF